MKDKTYGAIFQWNELLQLTRDYHVVFRYEFSTLGGLFDGWVMQYEFMTREGNIHYFFTDAFNVFNFNQKEEI